MFGIEETLRMGLIEAAQYPMELYFIVVLLLVLSSFGLPFPEEIILLTSGFIASVAMSEAQASGMPSTINPITLAMTCFLAVLLSDLLVFTIGKYYGSAVFRFKWIAKIFTDENLRKVQEWTEKFGTWACCIFRFTPGLRFPGHFMCGALGITFPKFLMSDGLAALVTVPTQVLLLAYYGDDILVYFKRFKLVLLTVFILLVVAWFVRRRRANQVHAPNNTAL